MRKAFKIASSATPTSAKTASHKVAMPPAPRRSTIAFTDVARMIFCQTIERVIFPARMAETILVLGKEKSKIPHRPHRFILCGTSPGLSELGNKINR